MKTDRALPPLDCLAYRPAEAAACIGISRAKIYEYIRSRQLRARKLDGATLVLRADLEAFVNALPDFDPDRADVA